ncbi:inositol-1-monophosphatase ImpA domain protein [Mycobacterium xenopi 4042]|uniref:Inositol-1-monophosphatase ImpA domain protein n=1 Tax=Mycobacterium xenopi 4042 TaxID=1299334 RepID=X7YQJ1_MYCXE|nr:inositol-1-monophosphatase ImpA domain protein [Mycobacterium xenopi 4042]EUA35154.1 inositol-1-monophosphatase ImpA domain protein [Mycobacterium xenopi 3993]
MDLDALVAEASAILDAATEQFVAGHRADSAVNKRATTSPPKSTWKSNAGSSKRWFGPPGSMFTARSSAVRASTHPGYGCWTRSTGRSTMRPARRCRRCCWGSCTTAIRWPD